MAAYIPEMQLPLEDITALIPQKQPFVLVDKMLSSDDTKTCSSFVVKENGVFVDKGFLQEAGLMENIAQTAALRAGYTAALQNKTVESGYIGSVTNFEVFELPMVADELLTEVNIQDHVFNVTLLVGKVWVKDKLIASCEMKVFAGNDTIK